MTARGHILLPAVAAVACVVALPLVAIGAGGPVRVAATLGVLGLAPGAAIAGGRRHVAPELGLAVALSLACSAVAAQAMLAAGLWAPRAATCALALLCLPSLALQIYKASKIEPAARSEA